MESQLSSDLTERRREIELDFTKVTSIPSSVADRGRILTLASSGDFGIAKSVLYEQMKSNQQDEGLLETIALLETMTWGQIFLNTGSILFFEIFPIMILEIKLE